ncbi:MAG: isocitrate lyase/PEP mutase family protein [Gammaproteobacteria bacterium]|jgi:2-methylisocitrate lyase-like PEP mutase family enzyme|nr:isocitrate lyase/PEP mutase family protein [Gammaproteobacteria bacterium]MDX2462461.1 isocitrate lyase/PEP mutase family protein [Gammaproteobacteria bacterium]
MTAGKSLWRDLMNMDRPFVLPGAYDALSAKLIERAGFDAFVIGGFPLVGARYGLPDIGLVGLGEMAEGMRDIVSAVDIPALIDGDHGYGDVKNVVRTMQTYESMGAGAILLEDQVAPKRCGHTEGKQVVEPRIMEEKLRAAADSRQSKDFFLIARTDSRAVHGLDDALRRAERYLKAGADGIFIEAPQNLEELERVANAFDVPQMCNMLIGGKTPILSNRELHQMGFKMIVHGTTLIKRVARSLELLLADMHSDRMECNTDQFATLEQFMDIVGLKNWQQIEESAAAHDPG